MADWHGKDPRDPKPLAAVDAGALLSIFPEGTFKEHRAPENLNQLLDVMLDDPASFGVDMIRQVQTSAGIHLRRLPGAIRIKYASFIENKELFELTVRRSFYDEAVVANIRLQYKGRIADSKMNLTPNLLQSIVKKSESPIVIVPDKTSIHVSHETLTKLLRTVAKQSETAIVIVPDKTSVHLPHETLAKYSIRMASSYPHGSITRDISYKDGRIDLRMQSGHVASNHHFMQINFGLDKPGAYDFDFRLRVKNEYATVPGMGLTENPYPKNMEGTDDLRKTSGLYRVLFHPTEKGVYLLNNGPEAVPLFFRQK